MTSEKPRVYHSFRSPYSRLGLHIVHNAKIDVDLIPFTGPPDGVAFSDPTQNRAKMLYYMQDAPRMTARAGLPMASPKPFDVDFGPADRALVAASRDGLGLAFAIALSDARWGRGENVSDLSVLENAATSIGWATENVSAAQRDAEITEEMEKHRSLIKKRSGIWRAFRCCRRRQILGT